MSARELLDRLEEQGMLEDSVIADLRRQLDGASRGVSAESIAKLLVDNGHITKFQATKLINDVTATAEDRRTARAESAEAKRQQADAPPAKKASEEDDLIDLPPTPEELKKAAADAQRAKQQTASSKKSEPKAAEPAPREAPAAAAKPDKKPAAKPRASAPETPPPAPAEPVVLDDVVEVDVLDDAQVGSADPLATGNLGAMDQPRAPARGLKKKTVRSNPWDSPLMLVGGFSLIVLIAVSVVMYYSLTRGTAAEFFEAAQTDYRGGSYVNAIAKYEKFLRYYPSDPNSSEARVRMNMAQLRIEAEGARDPQKGLEAAERILPTIENEEAFSEARTELATMLPDIARAFAERAKEAKTVDEAEALLARVDQAMVLVDNPSYIPTSAKKTQANVIDKIQETVTQVRRDMNQERELAKAVSGMASAIAAGTTREAFRIRDELVASYPGLEAHPEVVQKIAEIAERERDLITVSQQDVPATIEAAAEERARIVLFGRTGSGIPNVDEETVVLSVPGAVYGLDAPSGRVLWRKFVGYDVTYDPWRVNSDIDADALLVDGDQYAVLRVKPRTGEIVWRLEIGEAFNNPVLWRDRVLVTTKTGKVWNIDVASGLSRRQTELKQGLDAPAGTYDKFSLLYQVGENDNVYVVSIDTMECREVYYLGHRKGTVVVPPTFAAGLLFVPVNAGPDFAFIHVLAVDSNGLNLKPIQAPIRIDGHVIASPLVSGRRILFVTSFGGVIPYEINSQQDPPVTQEIAPLTATRSTPMHTYAVLDRASVWVADQRILGYDIQASQAQFNRRWAAHDGESFVAPLKRVGEAVVYVRGSAGSSGFRVTAVDGATGKEIYWQTDLSFPTLNIVDAGEGKLLAASSLGAVYSITPEALQTGLIEAAADLRLGGTAFQHSLSIADGRQVIFSEAAQALIYDPARADREMRLLRLNMPDGSAACGPILAAGGLLVPLATGQISVFDLSSGGDLVLPFQPQIRAGSRVAWRRPATIAADQKEIVIADDRQNLYRIGIVDTGGAHLAPIEQVTTREQIVGGLAVLDNTVFAILGRNDSDALTTFALPRLKEDDPIPLNGRVTWGPQRVNDVVLVATDTEGLSAWDASRQRKWSTPLPYGPLAGTPAVYDGDLVLASTSGMVWRVSSTDGREVGQHDVGEPLGGGPVLSGDSLLVPGADGTLFQIPAIKP